MAKHGLLEKKSKEEIINEVGSITDICLNSTERISEITKKISEFAKPDKTLVSEKVDVNEVIDESIAVLRHELALERINFKKEIRSKSPYANVGKGQLKQIFFNLIKNAAQAIDKKNGEIVIKVDEHGSDELIIKVIDNGKGIPQKELEQIFTPFYTTKEPGRGTGLGLALVIRLVERNNGKIRVESREGEGTTFILIFKRASDEQKNTNIG